MAFCPLFVSFVLDRFLTIPEEMAAIVIADSAARQQASEV
jgi:hypothetical protein